MTNTGKCKISIIDYGMGNLFSVKNACLAVGMDAVITSSAKEIIDADGVILPGVGAFGDAMNNLRQLDLVDVILEVASTSKPLIGICLGMQLLMTKSSEFGEHKGLGIITGTVEPIKPDIGKGNGLKVPHVCWSSVYMAPDKKDPWAGTILEGQQDKVYMYFVHSLYAKPESKESVISYSRYGSLEFCSAIKQGNVFTSQFHPERSGLDGLAVYSKILEWITKEKQGRC